MAYPKMGEITDKFVGQPYDLNSVLSPAKVWEKLDAQSEEVRVFVNGLIDLLNSTGEDNWLYTAIVNAILGQITDGSLTDVKLSDEAGQIKDRLTSFVATYDAFVATKGMANGFASLDSSGKTPSNQMQTLGLYQVGDVFIYANTSSEYSASVTSYTKAKEIKIGNGGVLRVKFDLNGNGGTTYGMIYVNGVAKGMERTAIGSGWVTFTEDISGLNVGDLIQIYVKNATTLARLTNFKLYASNTEICSTTL